MITVAQQRRIMTSVDVGTIVSLNKRVLGKRELARIVDDPECDWTMPLPVSSLIYKNKSLDGEVSVGVELCNIYDGFVKQNWSLHEADVGHRVWLCGKWNWSMISYQPPRPNETDWLCAHCDGTTVLPDGTACVCVRCPVCLSDDFENPWIDGCLECEAIG